jgi:hypothetical protein
MCPLCCRRRTTDDARAALGASRTPKAMDKPCKHRKFAHCMILLLRHRRPSTPSIMAHKAALSVIGRCTARSTPYGDRSVRFGVRRSGETLR